MRKCEIREGVLQNQRRVSIIKGEKEEGGGIASEGTIRINAFK